MFNEPREHHNEQSGLKKHSPQTPSFQANLKNSDVFPEHRLGLCATASFILLLMNISYGMIYRS
jgi:hypothetical protein